MNQNKYNFGSWICIPIIAYLSYMVNYLLDGFFQKNQDILMNGMKMFEQHLDQIMEHFEFLLIIMNEVFKQY